MTSKIVAILFIIAGVIHLIPSVGILGGDVFQRIYGLSVYDANLTIILRHRAVLFGLIGTFLVTAGFIENIQWPVGIAGLLSALSFIALAQWTGDYNEAIGKVILVDWFAAIGLAIALFIRLFKSALE